MADKEQSASCITARAKSNLAFALRLLPKERRGDMVLFYAFCRCIDDLADEENPPLEERKARLAQWHQGILKGFGKDEQSTELMDNIDSLIEKRGLPRSVMAHFVKTCMRDLSPSSYPSWASLEAYCYGVAGCVGIISAKLFGGQGEHLDDYAIALGNALQLTNILRDVREDMGRGRCYLPLELLEEKGYSLQALQSDVAQGCQSKAFLVVMESLGARTHTYYQQARQLLDAEDRVAMRPALVMEKIYGKLLERMEHSGWRVLERRFSLSLFEKMRMLLSTYIRFLP